MSEQMGNENTCIKMDYCMCCLMKIIKFSFTLWEQKIHLINMKKFLSTI